LSFVTAILLADDPMVLHAGSGRDENDKIWDALARFKVQGSRSKSVWQSKSFVPNFLIFRLDFVTLCPKICDFAICAAKIQISAVF
jgi:hypothetical protein